MPGRPAPRDASICRRFMPEPRPSANIATSTAASSATGGLPMTSRALRRPLPSGRASSAMALASISSTGSSDGDDRRGERWAGASRGADDAKPWAPTAASEPPVRLRPDAAGRRRRRGRAAHQGVLRAGLDAPAMPGRAGVATGTQPRDHGRQHRPGDDQRRDRDDQAEAATSCRGRPCSELDRRQRPRVRRHEPVQHRQAGERRDADLHQRDAGAPGDEDDDGHEQHDADLEEQRQPEDGRDQGHRPGQPLARRPGR